VNGKRVLDVGCGFGRYLLTLERLGARPIGVDVHPPYLQLSQIFAEREGDRRPRVVCATGHRLPFADQSFDWVLCLRALAEMDIRRALAEFSRVLADDGHLILAAATFREFFRASANIRENQLHPGSLAIQAINTFAFQLLNRRLFHGRSRQPMVLVHPTRGFLVRTLRELGLRPVGVHPHLQPDVCWFVCARDGRAATSKKI
jgi:ubiquinone/menaquinone biosynthesis C-methylase UbiE